MGVHCSDTAIAMYDVITVTILNCNQISIMCHIRLGLINMQ